MLNRGIYISIIKNIVQRYRKNGNIKEKKRTVNISQATCLKHISIFRYVKVHTSWIYLFRKLMKSCALE